jgi:possible bacteriophage resistance protein
MIPIHERSLEIVDIKILSTDDKATINYKNLLSNQLSWCNKLENIDFITKKARKLYDTIVNNKVRPQLINRCCNFLVDEERYLIYCKQQGFKLRRLYERCP